MNGIHSMPIKRKFFAKIDSMQAGECWNWDGTVSMYDYGHFYVNGVCKRAHRISWEIYYGKIPKDKMVLHKCDNRRCVNPSHLYLGDNSDNMKDRSNRNSGSFVGRHSRLNQIEVQKARELFLNGKLVPVELAIMFKCSLATISYAINHKRAYKDK